MTNYDDFTVSFQRNGTWAVWSWESRGRQQIEQVHVGDYRILDACGEILDPLKFYDLHGAAREKALQKYAEKRVMQVIAETLEFVAEESDCNLPMSPTTKPVLNAIARFIAPE